jgi:ABC-2 type transport system permease protein
MSVVAAQTKAELRLTMRNGEQLLLTLGIPILLLVFFSLVDVLPKPAAVRDPVEFLAPGVLALAVMSTSMVGLGIATGFERKYRVLKRLGATPLTRGGLLAAKTATVIAVELVQFAVLVPIAYALGWRAASGWLLALLAVLLGTVAFAGIGLTLAGRLPGEMNLAAVNGLYLVLLLLGGMIIPLEKLPGALRSAARLLPSGALAEALQGALTRAGSIPGRTWIVLAAWAAVAPLVASRTFRWE